MTHLDPMLSREPARMQETCDALLASILADTATFGARLGARMQQELAAYADMSETQMTAIPPLRWARLGPDRRSFAEPGARERFYLAGQIRARQGVPAGEMLQSYRILHQELRRRAFELVADNPDRDLLLLELFERSIAYVDAAMVVTAEGHRAAELELRRRDDHHHSTVVRKVLLDGDASATLRNDLDSFGIDWTGPLHAVRARLEPGTPLDVLRRHLAHDAVGGRSTGLVALIDRDLCGFVTSPPPAPGPMVVGISEPVAFLDLPRAFELASRAMHTALAFDLPAGIYDLAGLGVRAAVTADRDVGIELHRRFVAAFAPRGESGAAIVDTVRRYLDNGQRLDLTADALWVHVNTVRYRITRFEQLTGCSLKNTEDLVAVWWALQYGAGRATDTDGRAPGVADPGDTRDG
ncbi:hypothetical protein GCM10009836_36110 [Pseudonocardia ailaonensis]|uniref:PucR C-terminal helix-turn-helix domain-containing protein n=1 Tax=Pseudonocardia ailaonensis TaxID=367279 RepID=A0ABN2N4V0_9PSEU